MKSERAVRGDAYGREGRGRRKRKKEEKEEQAVREYLELVNSVYEPSAHGRYELDIELLRFSKPLRYDTRRGWQVIRRNKSSKATKPPPPPPPTSLVTIHTRHNPELTPSPTTSSLSHRITNTKWQASNTSSPARPAPSSPPSAAAPHNAASPRLESASLISTAHACVSLPLVLQALGVGI